MASLNISIRMYRGPQATTWISSMFVEQTSVAYPDQTKHLEILEETSKKTIDENKMAIGEKNIDENKMAIAENKLTRLEAHNLDVNLKE